ncbi:phage major tail tube protein [Escherichia coli]|uniref:phage major tail tube protein n=1 Tax=Escherichia coli TaxID=562 RepID=UPI00207B9797|nr:phage major tail tube protein [Escherichia coli]
MAVPKHLRFFTLFVDGENEVGKVTSVTPPKLTRKTDSYRGGGMMGAVSIDLGLDDSALDASFVMGELFVHCSLSMAARLTARCCVLRGEYYTDAEAICMKSRCAGV